MSCDHISELTETLLDKNLETMKVFTPLIAWHNRDRVSAIDFQPVPHPRPTKDGGTRIATGGDDNHVIVSDEFGFSKNSESSHFNNFTSLLSK